jgi:pSer/pThr/pTyr-binding forkhead associated (FHA) protein
VTLKIARRAAQQSSAPTVVGSSVTAAIRINAPGVGREHFHVIPHRAEFVLYDAGSKLGTFVDGQRVVNQTTLVDGQVITVAGAKLVFKCVS